MPGSRQWETSDDSIAHATPLIPVSVRREECSNVAIIAITEVKGPLRTTMNLSLYGTGRLREVAERFAAAIEEELRANPAFDFGKSPAYSPAAEEDHLS